MNSHLDRHPSSHLSETWSELTRPCPIITWDGLVKIGEHLHVDRIFYTTHVRPFGLLCSEAMSVHASLVKSTKVFACVNLAYTCCMRTLESITPNHHVVLRNNEPSQRCTVRGNTFLKFYEGSSYLCYRRSKKIRCKHDQHHMQIIEWHDMANIILCLWSSSLRHDMITFITGMTPWSPSSWSPSSCLHEVVSPTITSTTMANG